MKNRIRKWLVRRLLGAIGIEYNVTDITWGEFGVHVRAKQVGRGTSSLGPHYLVPIGEVDA